jgi:hypothetical protein
MVLLAASATLASWLAAAAVCETSEMAQQGDLWLFDLVKLDGKAFLMLCSRMVDPSHFSCRNPRDLSESANRIFISETSHAM